MKLRVEVDLKPEEIPLAHDFLAMLHQLTSSVAITGHVDLVRTLLMSMKPGEAGAVDKASLELATILADTLRDAADSAAVYQDMVQVFSDVVLGGQLGSTVPYIGVIARLPDVHKFAIRDLLVPRILRVLTLKRELHCSRTDVFPVAEAFAALVKCELVSPAGAVGTIASLVAKPETRVAAITALGKTVELCLPILFDLSAELRDTLKRALLPIRDATLQYDLDYIGSNLEWELPGAASSNAAAGDDAGDAVAATAIKPVAKPVFAEPLSPGAGAGGAGSAPSDLPTLTEANAWPGHQGTIFALCYDPSNDTVISTSKDSKMLVWDARTGAVASETSFSGSIVQVALNPRYDSLLLAQPSSTGPVILYMRRDGDTGWKKHAHKSPRDVSVVSGVFSLTSEASRNLLVAAQSVKTGSGVDQAQVCVYDVADMFSDTGNGVPIMRYAEHTKLITCVTEIKSHPGMFASGSQDKLIKLWDMRSSTSVATLDAHDKMVTCLDTSDTTLLSAGLDNVVRVTDLRKLAQGSSSQAVRDVISVDETPILKLAVDPSSHGAIAAVSTMSGLYLQDIATPSAAAAAAERATGASHFHDLRWSLDGRLYAAAGNDNLLHQFKLS